MKWEKGVWGMRSKQRVSAFSLLSLRIFVYFCGLFCPFTSSISLYILSWKTRPYIYLAGKPRQESREKAYEAMNAKELFNE